MAFLNLELLLDITGTAHVGVENYKGLAFVLYPKETIGLKSENAYLQALDNNKCSDNPFIAKVSCVDRNQCVPTVSICDAKKDCKDGSDETERACKMVSSIICSKRLNGSQFQCDFGQNVSRSLVCDRKADCSDGSDEHDCIRCNCKNSTSENYPYFQCKYGACIDKDKKCDGNKDCPDGSDEELCNRLEVKPAPVNEACKVPAHPLHGKNIVLCNGEKTCRKEPGGKAPNGSQMITDCSLKYLLAKGNGLSVCNNGVWKPFEYSCVECGVTTKTNQDEKPTLIHSGQDAKEGDFPWMAALYLKNVAGNWVHACGGTLVSPHVVLTAAHCVTTEDSGTSIKNDDVRIGLGKLFRDYYHNENATIASVREIVLPERYVGSVHQYGMDIALLDLTIRVSESRSIKPACLDLLGSLRLRNGVLGYLAGWGNTEHGNPSDNLLWNRQQYIDYESCLEKVGQNNVKYITHDKFCIAGVREGSQADKGDSGGGLTFTLSKVHFVLGIVSTRLPSKPEIVLFTNLANSEHRIWLRDQLRRLAKYYNN